MAKETDHSQTGDEAVSDENPPDADGQFVQNEEETETPPNSPSADESENDAADMDDDETGDEPEAPPAGDPPHWPAVDENEDVTADLTDDVTEDGADEPPAEELPASPAADGDENFFVALDDSDPDAVTAAEPEKQKASVTDKEEEAEDEAAGAAAAAAEEEEEAGEEAGDVQSETSKAVAEKPVESDGTGQEKKNAAATAEHRIVKKFVKGAFSPKILAAGLIFLAISGIIIYAKSALFVKSEKVETVPEQEVNTVPLEKSQTGKSPQPAQIQTPEPAPPGKYDKYLAKLEEAERLRNDLLEKKEDIYKLKLHYRKGIVELADKISQEMQKAEVTSLAQALKNKHIELSLRTIQRRRAYIQELDKPDRWAHNGSEELLFLKRKTLLDLQIADIASGIDLDRHLRDINAAIQKYQPSAENLSVDNLTPDLTPIETIWSQILKQQATEVQTPVSPKDEKIIAEICSGDSKHIAELATMTARAAKCLAQMNGSDLFLNGLKQLAPDEAKYLSQWQGNWICLNGVKKLSPAVARHLFQWQGSWISLNGLTEFPPELALYLMEWKGHQLELMGLNYHKKKPDLRALKFLALWETLGGKLYVSEAVRKQMERVM